MFFSTLNDQKRFWSGSWWNFMKKFCSKVTSARSFRKKNHSKLIQSDLKRSFWKSSCWSDLWSPLVVIFKENVSYIALWWWFLRENLFIVTFDGICWRKFVLKGPLAMISVKNCLKTPSGGRLRKKLLLKWPLVSVFKENVS